MPEVIELNLNRTNVRKAFAGWGSSIYGEDGKPVITQEQAVERTLDFLWNRLPTGIQVFKSIGGKWCVDCFLGEIKRYPAIGKNRLDGGYFYASEPDAVYRFRWL